MRKDFYNMLRLLLLGNALFLQILSFLNSCEFYSKNRAFVQFSDIVAFVDNQRFAKIKGSCQGMKIVITY